MSLMGHLQALPRRNNNGRFTSMNGHTPCWIIWRWAMRTRENVLHQLRSPAPRHPHALALVLFICSLFDAHRYWCFI